MVACVVAYNIITYTTYVESYGTIDGGPAPPRHAYAGAGARIACASYARTRAYATATPRAAASPASCSDSSAAATVGMLQKGICLGVKASFLLPSVALNSLRLRLPGRANSTLVLTDA